MPKVKQRPSAATIVSRSSLEQASARLQALPSKPREAWSLRETVALLQDNITGALNRGYTYDEIVKVLGDKKINITVSSLKRYLATARRDRGDAAVSKPRKTRAPKVVAVQPTPFADSQVPPAATTATVTKRQPAAAKTKKAAPSARRKATK